MGRVIFEIGGPNIRPEIAHAGQSSRWPPRHPPSTRADPPCSPVMRLAAAKLPVTTEVIDKTTPPRVGTSAVAVPDNGPRIITAGEYAATLKAAVEAPEKVTEL